MSADKTADDGHDDLLRLVRSQAAFTLRHFHRDDREEIVGRTVLEVLERGYEPASAQGLVKTILRNRARDLLRTRRSAAPLCDLPADAAPSPAESAELRSAIEIALLRACTSDEDRRLVRRFVAETVGTGRPPRLRELGREIWPERPQTACEHWGRIRDVAMAELERRGLD